MKRKCKKRITSTIRHIFLLVSVFLIHLPTISMVGSAFKNREDVLTTTELLPRNPSIENFVGVIYNTNYTSYLTNSIVVSLVTGMLCVIIAAFAGYSISRYKGKVFSFFSSSLLILQMFPLILISIPLFIILANMNLVDTRLGMILLYVTFFTPFSVWMFKSYFDAIPYQLEESAFIDGANKFRAMVSIVLPLVTPAIATIMIFVFILSWNEYLLASLFLRSEASKTVSVGMQVFFQQFSVDWASVQAAATIMALPPFIFILFAEKHLIRGMTAGALKG